MVRRSRRERAQRCSDWRRAGGFRSWGSGQASVEDSRRQRGTTKCGRNRSVSSRGCRTKGTFRLRLGPLDPSGRHQSESAGRDLSKGYGKLGHGLPSVNKVREVLDAEDHHRRPEPKNRHSRTNQSVRCHPVNARDVPQLTASSSSDASCVGWEGETPRAGHIGENGPGARAATMSGTIRHQSTWAEVDELPLRTADRSHLVRPFLPRGIPHPKRPRR